MVFARRIGFGIEEKSLEISLLGDLEARRVFFVAEDENDLCVYFSGNDGIMDGLEVRAPARNENSNFSLFFRADKNILCHLCFPFLV